MSEAADWSETERRHPVLGELLDLWAAALLFGLVVGAGLSPALKGSLAGLDWWIDRVDLIAGVGGQFAAMATWLLTIQLLLAGFRTRGQRALAAVLALLGVWPIVALMGAQRAPLPAQFWLGAIGATAAASVLAASAARRTRPWLAFVLLCAGSSLALELAFITTAVWAEHGLEVLPRLRTVLGLGAAGIALVLQTRRSPRGHLLLPFVAGTCLLLFVTAARASEPEATTWMLVVGRTVQSMTPDAPWALGAWMPSLQVCLALMAVGWAVLERLWPKGTQSVTPLLTALCALALAVPITPLSIAALTLLGAAALPTSAREPKLG